MFYEFYLDNKIYWNLSLFNRPKEEIDFLSELEKLKKELNNYHVLWAEDKTNIGLPRILIVGLGNLDEIRKIIEKERLPYRYSGREFILEESSARPEVFLLPLGL